MGTILITDELVEYLAELYEAEIAWCEHRDIVYSHTFASYVDEYLRKEGAKLS